MDPRPPHAARSRSVFSALLCGKNGSSEMTHEAASFGYRNVAELHAEGDSCRCAARRR